MKDVTEDLFSHFVLKFFFFNSLTCMSNMKNYKKKFLASDHGNPELIYLFVRKQNGFLGIKIIKMHRGESPTRYRRLN